jgi:large subunit ribosomal protein L22
MEKIIDQKKIVAKLKYFRISTRKVRPLLKSLRGKKAVEAVAYLKFNNSRIAVYLSKLMNSAMASAKDLGLSEDNLIINEFTCDEGPVLKRFRPGHRGVAFPYQRKLAHIQVVLTESKLKEKIKEVRTKPAVVKANKIISKNKKV